MAPVFLAHHPFYNHEANLGCIDLIFSAMPFYPLKFCHLVPKLSILEAFEGESFVHVVELGMTLGLLHGNQWPRLIETFPNRKSQPPRQLRVTAIGFSMEEFQIIGDELESYAQSLRMKLEFWVVYSSLENLKANDIRVVDGEVLVVNSVLRQSKKARVPSTLMHKIHKLSPKHRNRTFFLGRFMHYYSAIFDTLETMLPKFVKVTVLLFEENGCLVLGWKSKSRLLA